MQSAENSNDSDTYAAKALAAILGTSRWVAVGMAKGYLAIRDGATEQDAADIVRRQVGGSITRKLCLSYVHEMRTKGFLNTLVPREKLGSAENPVTKLFPARITEQRFIQDIEKLQDARPGLSYRDDREGDHTLVDFILCEDGAELPINIKNAGTRFERAKDLVDLEPDDCLPIPAYKAHAAVERAPSLLYVISADYDLVGKLNEKLPTILCPQEQLVWSLLNRFAGMLVRHGEDEFILKMVNEHWDEILPLAQATPFYAISARKSIRILQTKPSRTPGIGLRAWGTGAAAEVNVHVSIAAETTKWTTVHDRIVSNGINDIVQAVNRKRVEEVYDPEI